MSKKSVHIIGGGVIGLCAAWYLNESGAEVTVIDKGDLKDGASHGNAGMVVPSHVIPLSSPGMISQGIKWMFDSKSPFYVKPRIDLSLLQWTYKFYKSCNEAHVRRAMPALFRLNEWSKQLYNDFVLRPEFEFDFVQNGLLMLYKTVHQEKEERELAEKAGEIGLEAQVMDATGIKKLEPGIQLDVLGGVYFPGDANLHPNKFMEQLVRALEEKGVRFMTNTEVVDFRTHSGKVKELLFKEGNRIKVDNLLIAGGSWSSRLLKKLGVKIHLQEGKGYSATIKNADIKPNIPSILTEGKVAVSPMGKDLRIGGTLELGGMSTNINKNRLQGIFDNLPKYYPDLKLNLNDINKVWYGYRPCTPDGMPYIDKVKSVENLFVATGHAMMGMSMGPATGKLISEMIIDSKQSMDTTLFGVDRF
ncbi:FAD-dependent oxidoreductase [Zhouia spongiae]|uniref:FAD-dependent oxidoreductase n=1 Tax=Zhouia spongiae TaxID=2202721 RepID=A0ABY3YIW7_9FLAO|nr:FAD-dependent oxidoreductase [Zhouia spongiae]UNY97801.1 FAD-dependent oxidoreductase [Zhouia spongiae]